MEQGSKLQSRSKSRSQYRPREVSEIDSMHCNNQSIQIECASVCGGQIHQCRLTQYFRYSSRQQITIAASRHRPGWIENSWHSMPCQMESRCKHFQQKKQLQNNYKSYDVSKFKNSRIFETFHPSTRRKGIPARARSVFVLYDFFTHTLSPLFDK